MANAHIKTPPAIGQNNPGWLRHSHHPDFPCRLIGGLNTFGDMHAGVEALFFSINLIYGPRSATKLHQFVALYFQGSAWPLLDCEVRLAQRLGISAQAARVVDLKLDDAWRAIDMARAIVAMLNGPTPTEWPDGREWVPPSLLINAMVCTMKWIRA